MFRLLSGRRRAAEASVAAAADRLKPSRDVFSAFQDDIVVLLDLRRQQYLGIDEVGSLIWQGLERGASRADIEQELAAEFDAPPDIIREDTDRFLSDLLRRGLVVRT